MGTEVRTLAVILVLLTSSCAWTWEKRDFCDTGGCDECVTDEDCVVGFSCCGDVMYCMHQEEQLVTCQLACTIPPAPPCRCDEGICSFD